MNLVFLGPPGSGKGTQAVRLAESKGLVHLSTGDLLRDAAKAGTELGKKAEGFMKAGELVPDDLIVGLIEDKIASGTLENGFILDGFPRTIPQAECLRDMLVKNHIALEKAVLIAVDDEEIVRRLSGRWFCPTCQTTYNHPARMPKNDGRCDNDGVELLRRPDDEEAVVRNRLEVYRNQTQPIEDFYRNESILAEVSGERPPDEVFTSILEVVG
ncbi:MAG: adenylate kinase [candidate division Zixibacteria bacterium]|nr:adenylate kinase [candidate division Zixibacteria bacterium]MDH3937951.1 adenylate kinase [candidate division Zixibacteria bacterium]MDH4035793.1 adenylate kinase [candidate division Zixibacteria bacterium]